MQLAIVILLVAACAAYIAYQAWRYFHPRSGKLCAGGCCDANAPKPAAPSGPRTLMISSDDLRNRLHARK